MHWLAQLALVSQHQSKECHVPKPFGLVSHPVRMYRILYIYIR